jgi:hypothetical protein
MPCGMSENALQKSKNKGKRSGKSMAAPVRGGQGNIRVLDAAESGHIFSLAFFLSCNL